MDESDDPRSSRFPSVRIWLCGPFQIEWMNPTTGLVLPAADPTIGGRDRAAAISLLALLLCQPNRQAHRDWIMEQFWPESSQRVAVHRLENIFSCLRKLLRPPTGEESLLRSITGKRTSGTSYCLDAYPKLWVDLDAFTGNVEQAARLERFGEDALPFWQRAFALFKRGPFLVDDPYDAYATWVKEQRESLDGYSRQCVHALSRLYLASHTEAGKAEAQLVLRTYWQQHKTDEDALRPLLELLGGQERYQEAEEYYQQLLLTLSELEPDEEGQPRVPDSRTQDIRDYLRTKQIQRKRDTQCIITSAGSINYKKTENDESVGRRKAAKDIGILGLTLADTPHSLFDPSHTMQSKSLPLTVEMSYPGWVAAMETCWQLYFTGGIPMIEVCLPGLLLELTAAAYQPSRLQKQVMALTSQAYQMYWLLALQRQDFGQALSAIDQAYTYGKEAQDKNLELASLVRKAHVYFHVKNPVKQLSIHQQAAQYVDSVSPLMRSWFYLLFAENHASLRHEKEAATFLDLAYKTLPSTSIQDETFSYVHMNAYLISNFEIICQLHLNQPQQVLDTVGNLNLSVTDPRCSELANHRLTALYLLNDLDELLRQFASAVLLAQQTKSTLRSHELCIIYCKMRERWHQEKRVKELEILLC